MLNQLVTTLRYSIQSQGNHKKYLKNMHERKWEGNQNMSLQKSAKHKVGCNGGKETQTAARHRENRKWNDKM